MDAQQLAEIMRKKAAAKAAAERPPETPAGASDRESAASAPQAPRPMQPKGKGKGRERPAAAQAQQPVVARTETTPASAQASSPAKTDAPRPMPSAPARQAQSAPAATKPEAAATVRAGSAEPMPAAPRREREAAPAPRATTAESRPANTPKQKSTPWWRGWLSRKDPVDVSAKGLEQSLTSITDAVARDLQAFQELQGKYDVAAKALSDLRAEQSALNKRHLEAVAAHSKEAGGLKGELDILKKRVEGAEARAGDLEKKFSAEVTRLQQDLKTASTTEQTLQASVEELRRNGAASASDLENARVQIASLGAQLDHATQILKTSTILQSVGDVRVRELSGALERLRIENERLAANATQQTDADRIIREQGEAVGRLTAQLAESERLLLAARALAAKLGEDKSALAAAVSTAPTKEAPAVKEGTSIIEALPSVLQLLRRVARIQPDARLEETLGVLETRILSLKDPKELERQLGIAIRKLDEVRVEQDRAAAARATAAERTAPIIVAAAPTEEKPATEDAIDHVAPLVPPTNEVQ